MNAPETGPASTLPWPEEWRWTARRAQAYDAKATTGVRTVDVEIDGLREPALLLPMNRTPRWQGLVFGLVGLLFVGLAVAVGVAAVANGEWTGVIGLLVLGGFGVVFCLAAVAALRTRRDAVPGLRLSPSRVIFDGGVDQLAVSWNDISGIRLYTITYGFRRLMPRPWHNWLGIDVHDPSSVLRPAGHTATARVARGLKSNTVAAMPDDRMIMSPLVAYHVLRHYLNNSADRHELAGEQSVARVGQLG